MPVIRLTNTWFVLSHGYSPCVFPCEMRRSSSRRRSFSEIWISGAVLGSAGYISVVAREPEQLPQFNAPFQEHRNDTCCSSKISFSMASNSLQVFLLILFERCIHFADGGHVISPR